MVDEVAATHFLPLTMENRLLALTQGLELTEGASAADVAACQTRLGIIFPADLAAFLEESNGGERLVAAGYLSIYSIKEMAELSEIWWEVSGGTLVCGLMQGMCARWRIGEHVWSFGR